MGNRESSKNSIKVSVIIPVYNTQNYLRQCLDSVSAQSLKELEVICINDGSTDSSLSIMREYEKKLTNFTIIDQENRGYGAAINKGIKIASGEYIGIVDSDDFISRDMYNKLYETAKAHDADIVKSDFFEVRDKNGYCNKKLITNHADLRKDNEFISMVTKDDLFNNVGMNTWTGLYRLSFLRNYNIKYHESPGAAFQDNGFWFQTLIHAKRIYFIHEAFYYYRKDNPNSSVNNKNKVYEIFNEYDYIKKFFKSDIKVQKKYFGYYIIQKYFACMDALYRLDNSGKLKFLRRCADEFESDIAEAESIRCNIEKLNDYVISEVVRIIDSPEIYYYESMIDRYNRVYEKTHRDLLELKSSREYKIGEQLSSNKALIFFNSLLNKFI